MNSSLLMDEGDFVHLSQNAAELKDMFSSLKETSILFGLETLSSQALENGSIRPAKLNFDLANLKFFVRETSQLSADDYLYSLYQGPSNSLFATLANLGMPNSLSRQLYQIKLGVDLGRCE
jgi:hypothetical protein